MAIEISDSHQELTCCKCGTRYKGLKKHFPVSHAINYKWLGYIPVCTKCVNKIYQDYLEEIGDTKAACRQTCRNLNIYWNEAIYNFAMHKAIPQSLINPYITRTNILTYAGKTYDDTLREEESMWNFARTCIGGESELKDVKQDDIPEEVVVFWGRGFSPSMYMELEERKNSWMEKLKTDGVTIDTGGEALIKQICNLEIEINSARIAGKSIEKQVNTLNTLLGSLNLKPVQGKAAENIDNKQPLGVLTKLYENEEPIPDPDPKFEDVDGIKKYILTWFTGHIVKMLGVNKAGTDAASRLYEDEINKFKVENPLLADEDDDEVVYSALSEVGDDDD